MLKKQDLKYKEYLKLQRRLTKLYKSHRRSRLIKLDEPYQRGWEIYYDLRPDIKRTKDARLILEAIKLGFRSAYTRQVSHVKNVRRNFHVKHVLNPGQMKVDKVPSHLEKYFILDKFYLPTQKPYYIIDVPRWWLIRKVRPHIITHRMDIKFEKEIDSINDTMYTKYREFYMGKWHKSYPNSRARTFFRGQMQKFKTGQIDQIENRKFYCDYD